MANSYVPIQVGGYSGREVKHEEGDEEGDSWCRPQESLRDNYGTGGTNGIETSE